ncbi:DNA-directed RNA polymerase specialized sigma24 family protein [Mumia flava]|uniref:DNA-directed RNA polymerase specialized sigma24 family protein n=1 Tax=Mumia flava TaxID=1348852 RepID=A0A2M9BKG3_9ACTN|nr:sensor domain-containing protein [Mumia flava]PJJ58439.1 DNA-directed RNA polymerase specialized sigma24 family protein [Mumia flava]
MPKVDEFDTFYDSTSRYVTHLAYAVSGDRVATADAVAEAYEHAWRRWAKVRTTDPLAEVRSEAFHRTRVSRGTHPWRRRHEEDSDVELLEAMAALPARGRRLVVLQTLGELDLSSAAREVQMTDEAAVAATQEAVASLEADLGQSIGQLEGRLLGLAEVSEGIELPRPAHIRRIARRRSRRNTVVVVAAACAAVVAAGVAVAPTEPMSQAAAQERDRVGEASVADAAPGEAITSGSLMTATEVSTIAPGLSWTTVASSSDVADQPSDDASAAADSQQADTVDDTPLTACAPQRWATKNPAARLMREFEAQEKPQTVTQTIEVAQNADQARQAYGRQVSWFANCSVPGIRLLEASRVAGAQGRTTILRLRDSGSPASTITVGISQTGVATTFLLHDARNGAAPTQPFANALTEGTRLICADAAGPCPRSGAKATRAPLPPTSKHATYLALVDLPSLDGQSQPWGGTDPSAPRPNPAATLCDNATFAPKEAKGLDRARSRVYVIPNDKVAPRPFSVAETVARFGNPKQAQAYVAKLQKRIRKCDNRVESASVRTTQRVSGPGYRGRTWRIEFETGPKGRLYYHLALVRRGNLVAEVAQAGNRRVDLGNRTFAQLADRAGQRLANSPG